MRITEVELDNIRAFGPSTPVRLKFDSAGQRPRWIVLAGKNGAGKTTLLRAIALAVAGEATGRVLAESFAGWIHSDADTGSVSAKLDFGDEDAFAAGRKPTFTPWTGLAWTRQAEGPEPRLERHATGGNWTPSRGPWAENPRGWFIAGYGPFRRLSQAPSEAQRMMMSPGRLGALVGLFREDASLAESVLWLQQTYLRRLEGRPGAENLEKAMLRLLGDGLLPDGMQVLRIDSEGLWVRLRESGPELSLQSLSDGYRTVAALVLDVVKQIIDSHGDVEFGSVDGVFAVLNTGVVLIDEIDVHLHVSWQQQIGFWLKDHFPGIQFIVSTHSPFICQAADEGGLIKLSAPSEKSAPEVVSGELFNRVVNGSADDAVISDLFGLDTPYSSPSTTMRQELAALESSVANRRQTERILELKRKLPSTGSDEVERLLASLQQVLDK